MGSLSHLNKYFLRYKWHLISGIIFITLSNLFSIYPAQVVRQSIDLIADNLKASHLFNGFTQADIIHGFFYETVIFFALIILVMALLKGFFLYLTRQTIIVMSRLIEYDLKNEVYAHYQSLPISFYRKNSTGDLMNRISEDVSKVRMYLGPAVMYGINLFILFTLLVSYMFTVNVTLTLYVLLPLPILSISIYYVSNLINKQSEEIQINQSGLSTLVQEAFSGIRVLKSFAREKDFTKTFDRESESYKKKSFKLAFINALFFPLILLLIGVSTVLTVYVGGIEVVKGNITIGNIAEFVIYVNMLTWPVASLGWVTSLVQRASASQRRINEFLHQKSDLKSEKGLKPDIKGEIEFKNVDFTYKDSGIKALKGMSFKVQAGETVAIVGTTGSGKSTITNLITRMFDATGGQVLIDGIPIEDIDIDYLRGKMGYVPQDVFLFSDTIENNISFGKADISKEEIIDAAKTAHVHHNIMEFKKKYETVLGERGITLSGGQKQRVSIARAIVRNPAILLLDDCLSAVDTKTEDKILSGLKDVMEERTSIVVSHRISTVKIADRILVMDDGQIVESGTHDELMDKNGTYKKLYELQQEKEPVSS